MNTSIPVLIAGLGLLIIGAIIFSTSNPRRRRIVGRSGNVSDKRKTFRRVKYGDPDFVPEVNGTGGGVAAQPPRYVNAPNDAAARMRAMGFTEEEAAGVIGGMTLPAVVTPNPEDVL